MATLPYYVRCALRYAWQQGKYYLNQAKAASICFDILADYPDCTEVRDVIYKIFCDEWTIHSIRLTIFNSVEEWDDRPHSYRYRQAIAFRHLSMWDEVDKDGDRLIHSDEVPAEVVDVEELLEEGHLQLFVAYCMGHEPSADYAWTRFMEAVRKTINPNVALMWIAREYAENGYFADAADVLTELCSNDPKHAQARRFLAEVRWWRDYGRVMLWMPPPGDGSRYRRLQPILKPNWETGTNSLEYMLERMKVVGTAPTWEPSVNRTMEGWLDKIVPDEPPPQPYYEYIDWSYLDELTPEEWNQRVEFEELAESDQKYHTQKIAEAATPDDRRRAEEYLLEVRGKAYRRLFIETPYLPKFHEPRSLDDRNWDRDEDDENAREWEEWDDEEDDWDDDFDEDEDELEEDAEEDDSDEDEAEGEDEAEEENIEEEDEEGEEDDADEDDDEDDDGDDNKVLA